MREAVRLMWQWVYTLTPVIISIFVGLSYQLYIQQKEIIDRKADKAVVDKLCEEMKQKVDNNTLILMIESLNKTDEYMKQSIALNKESIEARVHTEKEQLNALHKIQLEMQTLNSKIERVK